MTRLIEHVRYALARFIGPRSMFYNDDASREIDRLVALVESLGGKP